MHENYKFQARNRSRVCRIISRTNIKVYVTKKFRTEMTKKKKMKKTERELYRRTSQTPLTRYPKKKPEVHMRNCCQVGRSDREIPNRDLDCSSLFIFFFSLERKSKFLGEKGQKKKNRGIDQTHGKSLITASHLETTKNAKLGNRRLISKLLLL